MIISKKSEKIVAKVLGYEKFNQKCFDEFLRASLDKLWLKFYKEGFKMSIKFAKKGGE